PSHRRRIEVDEEGAFPRARFTQRGVHILHPLDRHTGPPSSIIEWFDRRFRNVNYHRAATVRGRTQASPVGHDSTPRRLGQTKEMTCQTTEDVFSKHR